MVTAAPLDKDRILGKILSLLGNSSTSVDKNADRSTEGRWDTVAHIVVDDNEILEKAIKRFKRMVEKEGIIREYKKREYYEKPSTILNRKKKSIQRKLMKKNRKGKSEY